MGGSQQGFTGGVPLAGSQFGQIGQTQPQQQSPFGQRDQFGRVGPFAGRGEGGVYKQPQGNMFTGGVPLGGMPQQQTDLMQAFQQMFGGGGGYGNTMMY